MRKIIQIVDVQDTEYSQGYLTALCDDGTIWCYSHGKWSLIPEQIPQFEITSHIKGAKQ